MGLIAKVQTELAYLRGSLRALKRTGVIAKNPTTTIRDMSENLAARYADRTALISDRETLTYRDWNSRANRYARWFAGLGLQKGDVVALLMPNRPEYMCIWLGIAKAGGVTALINTNLTGTSLAHCINVVSARVVIVEASLAPLLEGARAALTGGAKIVAHGAGSAHERIDTVVEGLSDANLPDAGRVPLNVNDKCLYIYTSGTTGLPKAANINHYRVQLAMHGFSGATGARERDRMYDCLPMYHTVGGVVAPGCVLTVGGTCVIREKFSAREFWSDIVKHRCTMFAYVGELCRYLLHAPPGPDDRRHAIRLCVGNGLRPDVFEAFRDRFGLPHILELYAATEGNCSMFNFDSKPGAVGRIPKWAERRFVIKIIRFDVETGEPVRDAQGLCIECAPDEIGEMVGEILNDPSKPSARFEGYADKAATEKKILRDVKRKGDAWFRTGDLLKKDKDRYFYFVDRIGDTFRWKGENVSTTEVSEAITSFPGVVDCTVYGVGVPGAEGRAGMAALVTDPADGFDVTKLPGHLAAHLPEYARPLFLRFQGALEITGTFKQRKVELVKEGFDPGRVKDRLFVYDGRARQFKALTPAVHAEIAAGGVRL